MGHQLEREFPAKQINLLKTYQVPLNILVCVVYDATPFMTGIKRGLGGEIHLKHSTKIHRFHCISPINKKFFVAK